MSNLEVNIIAAAADRFVQEGAKRTNMTTVAKAAGVSRQTVYSYFAKKNDLLAAVTQYLGQNMLETIERRWRDCACLDARLDVYLEVAILNPFDILQRHPELKELLLGSGLPAAKAAAQIDIEKARMLADLFECHADTLRERRITPQALGNYLARVTKELKYSCADRAEIEQHLNLLKLSTLALIGDV